MGDPLKSADIRAFEQGNKPRGRHTARTDMVPAGGPIGEAPDYFTQGQRLVWDEFVRACDPGLLQASDAMRFEQLVIAAALLRDLVRAWNAEGCPTWVPGKRGGKPSRHQLYADIKAAQTTMAPIAYEFGLSPLARSKVKVQRKAEVSPLDRFTKPLFPDAS